MSVKMSFSQFRTLTIEAAVEKLGIMPTENTYVYFNNNWELDAMEIRDHSALPEDELDNLGFVSSYR